MKTLTATGFKNDGFAQSEIQIKSAKIIGTKVVLTLTDGRQILAPVSKFKGLRGIALSNRKSATIIDNVGIYFKGAKEVYHIQDFLGIPENYIHQ
jgi:hypothetical protein